MPEGPSLHGVIMEELKRKDLGDTGFVTVNEILAALQTTMNVSTASRLIEA